MRPVTDSADRPPTNSDPGVELVEWVNADGSLIEVVSRHRMRAEGLRHRSTYVAVLVGPTDQVDAGLRPGNQDLDLDPDLELVVHRRADWKDIYPGRWDLAFGGVCGVGEDWLPAARRELWEEAGIDVQANRLVDLGPVRWDGPPGLEPGNEGPATTAVVGRVFVVFWPDEPVSMDGEAVAFDRVPLGQLEAWLGSNPVCPDSAAVVPPLLRPGFRPIFLSGNS